MRLIKFIPNLFTLGNLCLGVVGIYWILKAQPNDIHWVSYFILTAAILDFFDGFLAKALHAQSEIGAQLDSLADLITFGVLPGFIYWHLVQDMNASAIMLIIPVCSAWRLAKFNAQKDQTDSFKGISTTAHGLFSAALLMIALQPQTFVDAWLSQEIVLVGLALGFSVLMISNMRMISLKFKSKDVRSNWDRYLLILGSLILAFIFAWSAAPFIMLLYLSLSIYKHYTST